MKRRAFVSLAVVVAFLLSAGQASAQEDRGVRFRLGASGEGGPLVVPDVTTVGVIGAQAQAGLQISNSFGIYALGSGGLVVGEWSGVTYAAALMLELTFNHVVLVGAGAELGGVNVSGNDEKKIGGAVRGGRIHVAWCPACNTDGGALRQGFTVGVDVRLLGGSADFFAVVGAPSESTTGSPFMFSPMLNIGYLFF
jgi:hypothetical protein